MNTLTVGSLFSGIGGIDLGLERAGMRVVWQVEHDEFCQQILQKHWPDVARFRDIRELDASTLARVDVLCGGFPCQPHSYAGKREASADERNLWPEFARCIRELKPRWVLAENVMGLFTSENGQFFGAILRDLATCGYDAEWFVLRASDVGAPHRRERVFIVAHATSPRCEERKDTGWTRDRLDASGTLANTNSHRCRIWTDQQKCQSECNGTSDIGVDGEERAVGVGLADAHSKGLAIWNGSTTTRRACATLNGHPSGQSQSCMGRGFNGVPGRLDRHHRWPAGPGEEQYGWEPPRVTHTKQTNRAARLKALGNAVVPQVAELVGRMIVDCEASND